MTRMGTATRGVVLAATVVAAGVLAPAASAQTCFRGKPSPSCRSFFVTEAEAGVVISQGNGTGGRFGVDLGFMRNLGSGAAVGVTIGGGYALLDQIENGFVSLRPRYRFWLSPTASLDVGPGLQWTPGRIERVEARAAFMYRDLVGVWTEVDFDWGHGSHFDWLFGARIGGQAGVISYIAGAITLGILVAVRAGASS